MKLYDTLSTEKREFTPNSDVVKMYVCGPNLYGPCHVGHALSYIYFDVLRRYLEYVGYQVYQVQNFTDIEDRIIEVSNSEGLSLGELSNTYIQRFMEEMDALGVQRAHEYPRATHYIGEMIKIVEDLIAKGHAYEIEGDVYFRGRHFQTYGRLSKRPIEEMQAGTRIEVDLRKEDPMDFSLWKKSKLDEPSWDSPWGLGRPGWHIECTAMSVSLLGSQIDIHGGGQDVIFPHHEHEIAQSESYTGDSPFVNFWIHNGLLRLSEDDTEKMTRHTGNFVSCRDAIESRNPEALRIYFLSSHYRSPLTYSDDGLDSAERSRQRLINSLREEASTKNVDEVLSADDHKSRFITAMDDDLNTPQALASLFDLARDINRSKEQGISVSTAQSVLKELALVLGLSLEEDLSSSTGDAAPFIDLLVQIRSQLRDEKQWALGDSIRDQLQALGVNLEDAAGGTKWRMVPRG